jgi:hypothetical protein
MVQEVKTDNGGYPKGITDNGIQYQKDFFKNQDSNHRTNPRGTRAFEFTPFSRRPSYIRSSQLWTANVAKKHVAKPESAQTPTTMTVLLNNNKK